MDKGIISGDQVTDTMGISRTIYLMDRESIVMLVGISSTETLKKVKELAMADSDLVMIFMKEILKTTKCMEKALTGMAMEITMKANSLMANPMEKVLIIMQMARKPMAIGIMELRKIK